MKGELAAIMRNLAITGGSKPRRALTTGQSRARAPASSLLHQRAAQKQWLCLAVDRAEADLVGEVLLMQKRCATVRGCHETLLLWQGFEGEKGGPACLTMQCSVCMRRLTASA
jgi:hypothetical protein